jgi:hypothetical protein
MTTQRTYRKMHNPMETIITRRMAMSLHPYIIRHTKKLVYKIGTPQRNYKLDNFVVGFCNHVFI